MIRIINNYSFLNEAGAMVDPKKQKKKRFYLHGRYTDSWSLFIGTENCVMSAVTEITENEEVITQNSIYKLGTISEDYKEFLEVTAAGKRQIVLANWNIYGSKEHGYYMTADIFPEKKAMKAAKIISQEGNFLIIQRLVEIPSGNLVWDDPEPAFVCWNSMSKQAQAEIQRRRIIADIKYLDFKRFDGVICKPILFETT